MSVRTVRLDEEAEKALAYIVRTMGLSISGALKYAALDLGPGGYAIWPSTETRHGVQEAIKRKPGR